MDQWLWRWNPEPERPSDLDLRRGMIRFAKLMRFIL